MSLFFVINNGDVLYESSLSQCRIQRRSLQTSNPFKLNSRAFIRISNRYSWEMLNAPSVFTFGYPSNNDIQDRKKNYTFFSVMWGHTCIRLGTTLWRSIKNVVDTWRTFPMKNQLIRNWLGKRQFFLSDSSQFYTQRSLTPFLVLWNIVTVQHWLFLFMYETMPK